MAFVYYRTIRFADTDAAGVVYFATVLSICHEAYEAALAAAGIDLQHFFRADALAVPIVHVEADYLQPMVCGEACAITVEPTVLSADRFRLNYQIYRAQSDQILVPDRRAGRAATVHVCIDSQTRQRTPFSPELATWLNSVSPNPVSPNPMPSNPDII